MHDDPARTLCKRKVDDRLRSLADRIDPVVADETDDLGFGLASRLNPFAKHVLSREVCFRECLVDNRDCRRICDL